MNMLPVNPARTKNGALVTISKIVKDESLAIPIPLKPTDPPFANFNVYSDSIQTNLAAKLGIGTIFSGNLTSNEQGFYYHATAYTDAYAENPGPDKVILATRWGVGFRVCLRVTNIKGDISLNYLMASAAVAMGMARATYEITGIGIGVEGLILVLGNIPTIGDYNYETYYKLTTTVTQGIAKYISDNKSTLTPQPYEVGLAQSSDLDPILTAESIYFAMRALQERRPLQDALSKIPLKINASTVRYVYGQVAGNVGDTDKPSSEAGETADKWLSVY